MKKLKLLLSAVVITALTLPIFVFAAAPGAPPTGLVAPVFNGLYINNGVNNLTIAANGAISNAAANVVINDNMEVTSDIIVSGDSSVNGFAWNGGDTRLGDNLWVYKNGGIQNLSGSFVEIRDTQGFQVGNDGGNKYFQVSGSNGNISNPSGVVNIDDDLSVSGNIYTTGGGSSIASNTVYAALLEATNGKINGNLEASGNIFTTGGSSSISSAIVNAGTLNASSYEGLTLYKYTRTFNSNPSSSTQSCLYDSSWTSPIFPFTTYYYFYCITPV